MEDLNGIFDGFINQNIRNSCIYRLYIEKYVVSLNDFYGQTSEDFLLLGENKRIETTLNYIKPFLKKGKLKIRLRVGFDNKSEAQDELKKLKNKNQITQLIHLINDNGTNWSTRVVIGYDFSKDDADDAIEEIKKRWLAIENDIDKNSFEEFEVLFTLPENDWGMWK